MKTILASLLLFCILQSCRKGDDKILILDYVSTTRYYQDEIFNEANLMIYGKWKFLKISGGIGGETYPPDYDYLEIVRYGIFGIIVNNSIKEIGRITVTRQDSIHAKIVLTPDPQFMTDTEAIQREVRFMGKDALYLWDGAADGYFYLYKRTR